MEERFWKKVRKSENCWEWTSMLNKTGYGGFAINSKKYLAHRVAYELHHKTTIPEGLVVRHKCDNRKCCNPTHLELGTVADNNRDMIERGRNNHPKGIRNGRAKLTEDQVIEIKTKLKNWKYGDDSRISKEYNVSHITIHSIKIGILWKHIIV